MSDTIVQNTETERSGRAVVLGYACAIFLSAFLLFQVQLVIGKSILPMFGGTPSVWNTCMLFFQVLLLLGYGYSHLVSMPQSPRLQSRVHSSLLIASLAVLLVHWMKWGSPLTPGPGWKLQAGNDPVWKILELLSVTVALPFFVLSTTGPLLQKWFCRIPGGTSPYRLYALSNAGSLLGLLSYPFLFEWTLTVNHQAKLWSAGYVSFILLCLLIALSLSRNSVADRNKGTATPPVEKDSQGPGTARYLLWIALSTCSSTMLLATTNLLCQDIAVIPLLWVLPLGVYLLTFMIAFDSGRWYKRKVFCPLYFLSLGLALKVNFISFNSNVPLQLIAYSLALFAVCIMCHGELARSKPHTQYLTSFYLTIASGGALGGIFVVLVAPQVFRGFWEFRVALLGCGFLLIAGFLLEDPSGRSEESSWVSAMSILIAFFLPQLVGIFPRLGSVPLISKEYYTCALAAGFLLVRGRLRGRKKGAARAATSSRTPWQPVATLGLLGLLAILAYATTLFGSEYLLFQERNFFGVKYVLDGIGAVDLKSGSILHGTEIKDPLRRNTPTLYFRRGSGIGLLLDNYPRGSSGQEPIRAGLIGLGAGTLAAYGRRGDYFCFYEIDPAVIALSTAPKPFFHFVQDSPAKVHIVEGDARLSLEREAQQGDLQQFDVLAVDAFSGDAIPVHLLTGEAMDVYMRHLRGVDAVLALHISNRYLDLAPVVAGLAELYHLHSIEVNDGTSKWILLAQNPAMLRLPNLAEKSTPIRLAKRPMLWTDDYSNLFRVLRWFQKPS